MAYTARFREIITALDLTEFSLCDHFYHGLKEDVKDAIVYASQSETLMP
jgi:hypothetical protein